MRIAILTAESPQGNLITARLLRQHGQAVCGVLVAVAIERGRSSWRSTFRLGTRVAPSFLAWKAGEYVVSAAARRWRQWAGRPAAVPSLATLTREHGVPLVKTDDVNGSAAIAVLQRWQADLAVSVHFTHRIGPPALATTRLGMLNVHGALLPRNRGLFPYFWELANGDVEAGVTVHWIDGDLDTGDLVVQRRLPIATDETVGSLSWKGAALGADLLETVLALLVDGRPLPRTPQVSDGASYRSWPVRTDVRALRSRGRRFGSFAETWRRVAGVP